MVALGGHVVAPGGCALLLSGVHCCSQRGHMHGCSGGHVWLLLGGHVWLL